MTANWSFANKLFLKGSPNDFRVLNRLPQGN